MKIRDRPRFFDQVGHQTTCAYIGKKHFFTKSCHRQTYQNYEQPHQKIVKFILSKTFFSIENQQNLSEFIFFEVYYTRSIFEN